MTHTSSPLITLITDGSALKNPGPGGWCAILVMGKHSKSIVGGERHTTNNRMEILAVISGLRALKQNCQVEILSDSQYVIKGITLWVGGWQKRGWVKSNGQPVLNQDLWLQLMEQVARHEVKWTWVKGHNGHDFNEQADEMANAEARRQSRLPD